MHTHFGSATHLASTFLGVLIAGTFWRLGWLRAMKYAATKKVTWLYKLASVALAQY